MLSSAISAADIDMALLADFLVLYLAIIGYLFIMFPSAERQILVVVNPASLDKPTNFQDTAEVWNIASYPIWFLHHVAIWLRHVL